MNPTRFVHSVSVTRAGTAIVDGKQVPSYTSVAAGLRSLVEPLVGKHRESVLGRVPRARHRITWCTTALKNGDRVTWKGQVFILRELLEDASRPAGLAYFTAILEEGER